MSLLMDALRRAEAERRLLERAEPAAARLLSGADDATVVAGETAPEAPAANGAAAREVVDDSLALDLSELTLAPLELTYTDVAGASSTDATATGFGPRGGRIEQTSTLPSNRALNSDMKAYFDQSQAVEGPRGAALADMTLEDVAAHTVVGARTVFAAGERPRGRGRAAAAVVLGVVLLLAVGVLGVFYAAQTRVPQYVPSPTVADGVEKPLPRALPVVAVNQPPTPAAVALPRVDVQAAAPIGDSMPSAQPEPVGMAPAVSDTVQPQPPAVAPSLPAAADTLATDERIAMAGSAAAAVTPTPAIATPPATPASGPPTPTTAAPAPATVSDVNAGELRIARNRLPPAIDTDVARAYAAFKAGDLVQAETYYRAALVSAPRSRDALLGLAGVALARGDQERAHHHYRQVLTEHPGDPVASAALFSLTGAGGDRGAAQLKLLIDDHPDLALLRFSLGNWYARAGRWPDAQQAYFEAVRLDADNADYAYNLAVALDRMGQRAAALGYYQKSLDLADRGATSFNPAAVLARIGSLAAAATP